MLFKSNRTPTLFAGKLRHRVDICIVSPAQDSAGGQTQQTVAYAQQWASIDALSGTDAAAVNSFVPQASHQIIIRFIGAAPSWVAVRNYLANALVVDSNLNLQQAQAGGGLSGATAPVWNQAVNGLTTDGDPSTGITWKNLGTAPLKTGINAAMRVLHQGHIYEIRAVLNPDSRNKMLALLCVEIADSNQQTTSTGTQGSFPAPDTVTDIDGGTF